MRMIGTKYLDMLKLMCQTPCFCERHYFQQYPTSFCVGYEYYCGHQCLALWWYWHHPRFCLVAVVVVIVVVVVAIAVAEEVAESVAAAAAGGV